MQRKYNKKDPGGGKRRFRDLTICKKISIF